MNEMVLQMKRPPVMKLQVMRRAVKSDSKLVD